MVAHLSSKLSHLANSFRPQHHFNSLRNAFPSASGGTTTGFFDPANVFHQANNAVGAAAGQAAGAGASGTAGGAGGAKWSAGSRAPNWGFQAHGRVVAQAPGANDTSSRLNDDESDEHHLHLRRQSLLRGRRPSHSRLPVRQRSNSLSSSDRPDLLRVEESGLSTVRLSSAEMQRRYRSAFSQGHKTVEVKEMEQEADEIDFGPPSIVARSGRRASVSSRSPVLASQSIPTPTPAAVSVTPSTRRSLHTTRAFPRSSPPLADVPRVRRNSTSNVAAGSPPPLPANDVLNFPKHRHRTSEKRPPTSLPSDIKRTGSKVERDNKHRFNGSSAAAGRHNALHEARISNDYRRVESAVRQYLIAEDSYSTASHNAAMEALYKTRVPDTPLTNIIHLYNQLFEHENLRPDTASYDLIIKTFCTRDAEIARGLRFIDNRIKKKKLSALARGPWDIKDGPAAEEEDYMMDHEKETLERLQKEDYFTHALDIYKALGTMGDSLPTSSITALIVAACNRRRVDLALSLLARLERSPHQKIVSTVYVALIRMFGAEKDAESIMEVFNGYVAGRQSGSIAAVGTVPARVMYKTTPTKSAHYASPDYKTTYTTTYWSHGDGAVWRQTIKALFEANDSAQGVAVFEKLLEAIEKSQDGKVPTGYPQQLTTDTITAIVVGFQHAGDFEAAQRWFDRGLKLMGEGDSVQPEYFTVPFYSGVNASSPLVNHVYRAFLNVASPKFPLVISDFITVMDHNAALTYSATTDAERDLALDTILEFRAAFAKAIKANLVENVSPEFTLSTGVLSRIAHAFGHAGRFDVSVSTTTEFVRAIEQARRVQGRRSEAKWTLVASDKVPLGALGLVYAPEGADGDFFKFSYASEARPTVQHTTAVASQLNKLRLELGWGPVNAVEAVVVDSYLRSKTAAKGDVESLQLSGDAWYTIIQAFAEVSSLIRTGAKFPFEFPGFEPIIDDFAASGASIPSDTTYDYAGLVRALRNGGMSRDRASAVLAILNHHLARDVDQYAQEAAATPVVAEAEVAAEVAEATPSLVDTAPTTPETFPTPASTPPTYFESDAPVAPAQPSVKLDLRLGNAVDSLIYHNKVNSAFDTILASAQKGIFAHPDTYGRLIAALGRENNIDAVRQTYLAAYSALPGLEADPAAQSTAWVMLEDHMIVACAQAGLLPEVAEHRNRLFAAGSAPSADAYAAMILNAKETTDDAAVALDLFEQSQSLGVQPNVYLFNTLISKLSRARRAKEALEYFELMKQHGLHPSSITYGALINACCKTGDDVSADYLFKEMVAAPHFKPRVPPYNTMIQFFTQTQPSRERALHYYQALLKARVQPTGHTYKLLLDAYGTIGTPDLPSMQQVFTTLLADRNVTVTGAHWASLIHAYGTVAKNLDRATSIFDSIATHPSTLKSGTHLPDAVVYEALLNAFLANDRADLCSKYLAEMEKRGVRMTAYVANTLIKGHAAQKNLDSARAVFESMQDPPSGVAAAGNHPVDRHPKHTHHSTDTISTSAVYREPSSWGTMIQAELDAGENEKAVALMRRLEERAFPEAVVARIRKLLSDIGIESLPTPPASA